MKLDELYTINQLRVKPPVADGQNNYDTLNDYVEGLKREGFTSLGQGKFGAVFTNDQLGYAVKIFTSSDKGYPVFLRYVLGHRTNPHLPRIRGRFKQINKDYSACRLELLTRIEEGEERAVNALCRLILTGYTRPESFLKDVRGKLEALSGAFSDDYINTMFDLYRWGRRHGRTFDLHAGNVMKRGSVLVIVDPFS